jgi:hypothetical protein
MLVIDKLYKETQTDGTVKYFTLRKKFLGKLMDFDTPSERKFEKRHLKAYLKNQDFFNYEGMRFKTQYGVSVIPLTEEDVKKQKDHIIELIREDKVKHASEAKVYA